MVNVSIVVMVAGIVNNCVIVIVVITMPTMMLSLVVVGITNCRS